MLTVQELRTSSHKELLAELVSSRKNLLKLRMDSSTRNLKDTSQVTKEKQYIARLKTMIRELEMEEMIKSAVKL